MTERHIWMGVDLGNARVGIALSDPDLLLAHPEDYIESGGDYFYIFDDVIDIIASHEVEKVIVSFPLQLDGSIGKSAKKAQRWSNSLKKRLAISGLSEVSVQLKDERLSSVAAHDQLLDAGISMRNHRSRVDSQSAVILLQSALDDFRSSTARKINDD